MKRENNIVFLAEINRGSDLLEFFFCCNISANIINGVLYELRVFNSVFIVSVRFLEGFQPSKGLQR